MKQSDECHREACARRPVQTLTERETQKIEDHETTNDEKMAREMQEEEERRFSQCESDRLLARTLADMLLVN